ncbi:HAD family hydrolase [Anaerobacillus isosaccharinicus]|uniref:HAD family hydrolase n=1 Tax=Anaerobacillus isosaccharinicus TaxID=1532552 RepID=A0A7S7RBB2_9BACI|nr:HAD-IB family hydrolase [Anaerobacillus isosaccharinicus]MBA5586017.1 HAD-IB family hydrolase [Anaerobacillus isosaccharinicus]QOY35706.1 HAD-IB family hydrolase [Anaerobacillus isosaccharinicus]
MKVAIFDFDGTLYPEETFSLMMKHLKTHPIHNNKYRRFIRRILPVYIAYKLKLYPEQKMKEYSMRSYISAFGQTPETDIRDFFSKLGSEMSQKLSEQVLQRLHQHRNDGYYIMLVSGAFEPLLHSVTKDVSFNCIIGTSIPFKNKEIDKETPVIHIHGERKTANIYAQLANNEVDWENSYAYGDSYSDLNVLELVGNPVAVKPDPRLMQIATDRKWEIIS